MGIIDIFSKRQMKLRGEMSDVYTYDEVPKALRVQVNYILRDVLGDGTEYTYTEGPGSVYASYKFIVESLCREYGEFQLVEVRTSAGRNYLAELGAFILNEGDVEKVLDAIELSFQVVDAHARKIGYRGKANTSELADNAIAELNGRFREHGVGYQFSDGRIIRTDSELVHAEVVKPALSLLRGRRYAGAQAEFLKAHEHYRHGQAKDALSECLKALESTMKAICDKRGWKYQPNATCSSLIDLCVTKGLIPTLWTQHFSSLRSTLETGVPPARNKLSGHGQGSTIVDVPQHIVAYVIHTSAAAIVFLAQSEEALG